MKKTIKAVTILAMSLLSLFELNPSCHAETIVHLDRNSGARATHASSQLQQATHEQETAYEPEPQSPGKEISSKENAQQVSNSKQQATLESDSLKKDSLSETPQIKNIENTANQSTDSDSKVSTPNAAKLVDNYLGDFIKKKPEFTSSFGGGGDLAGLSSSAYCMSTYRMNSIDTKEWITITTLKIRTATAFYSDTDLLFFVRFNLKIPVIVSAKRSPLIELTSNGVSKIIKFKKISNYSLTGFDINTGNVHLLDELYSPNTTIVLLLETKNGPQLRIPIPENVIKQWQQVTSADLKKMRREFDER